MAEVSALPVLRRSMSRSKARFRVTRGLGGVVSLQMLTAPLSRTDIQLFHFRVEGRAFHSKSSGCARSTTDHSACLFQSLKDKLTFGGLRHLARGWVCATRQLTDWNAQDCRVRKNYASLNEIL